MYPYMPFYIMYSIVAILSQNVPEERTSQLARNPLFYSFLCISSDFHLITFIPLLVKT